MLPNTFALVFTNLALANQIHASSPKHLNRAIAHLAFACALFRSELSLYLFPHLALSLLSGPSHLLSACRVALTMGVFAAVLSIAIDSYFWRRPSYPELEVFHFNAILNKSAAWGVLPWHWYATRALPRAAGASLPLAVVTAARLAPLAKAVAAPAAFFVAAYSFLPHKELRFVLYVVPALNALGAVALRDALRRGYAAVAAAARERSSGHRFGVTTTATAATATAAMALGSLALAVVLAASGAHTIVAAAASRHNYPAAHALRALHAREELVYRNVSLCARRDDDDGTGKSNGEFDEDVAARGETPLRAFVHIDEASAMTGISQFVYRRADERGGRHNKDECLEWNYSKEEGLADGDLTRFSHLVSARRDIPGFCVVVAQHGFDGVDWRKGRLRLNDMVFGLRNINITTVGCLETR